MNAKHTPGPWHINGYAYKRDDAAPSGRRVFICNTDFDGCEGYSINAANVQVCDIKRHTRLGDARLIAAAPELLEACQRALPWIGKMIADGAHMHSVAPNDCVGAMEQMHAAIAKATGGDRA